MSKKTLDKKQKLLGMPLGTAANRLRRDLLFTLAEQLGLTICYRCGQPILTSEEFSIDHKIHWMYSTEPKQLFFDLNNIAFSHQKCNSGSRKIYGKKVT